MKRVEFTDVSLRDGQQSFMATRMKTEDMIPIAEKLNKIGFHAIEAGGGATFDVAIRFLNEDPWERIRILKKLIPNTPLQIHIRGQNLVGYRNYSDDVVTAFVKHASDCGVDIFRIFDVLNDEQNLTSSIKAAKDCKKHVQLQIQYSTTELSMGGPIYNLDYYVKKALSYQELGADSICISDSSGLLSPYDSYDLFKELKNSLSIPLELRSHCNSGMASMSCLKAIEAGVDIIDTVFAPIALRSSLPATETMGISLRGTTWDPKYDITAINEISNYLETILPKYQEFLDNSISLVNVEVLTKQIPGGMVTNLIKQLRDLNSLDRLEEVLEEVPKVRKEMGYPPMATPASQIVVVQAVQNVLAGRYKMMSRQAKDLINGLYGKTPGPIDSELQIIAQKGGTSKSIDYRPDKLAPELEGVKQTTEGISKDIGDVLLCALFPDVGEAFLKSKYNL